MRDLFDKNSAWLLVTLFLFAGPVAGAGTDTELLQAAQEGKFLKLESLLKNKPNVNAAQPDGTTALAWAVYHDNEEAVDQLIRAGADVNASNDVEVTLLHLACTNQNAGLVAKLLKAGADPNRAKRTGETPLMTCSNTGVAAGVSDLLAHGADPNAKESKADQTALMWAAAEKHPEVVKVLVNAGADVNATSRLFTEPEPFVVDVPNIFGRNYPSTVRFRETSGGFSPLMFAAQQGDLESAKHLLDGNADIDYATKEEGSALVIAAAGGHEELALYLLKRGADPDIKDAFGMGAIHFAVHEGIIVLNGAEPSQTDNLGWERKNMPRLLSSLLDYDVEVDAPVLYMWPYLDNPFLRSIEEASQIDITGATPLLLAAASGDVASMKLLVQKGLADKNAMTAGGATVFMLAAGAGAEKEMREEATAIEAAEYALSIGEYNINQRLTDNNAANGPGAGKNDGRTIIHFAASLGWDKMVRFLAENGADLDVEDRYGQTALKIAMGDPEALYYRQVPIGRYDDRFRRTYSKEYPDVIKVLLDAGAKPFTGKFIDKGSVN